MKLALAGFIALITLGVAEASETPWRGFLWPVKTDQTYTMTLGEFETLDACRRTAIIKVLAAGWDDDAFWECGLNCTRRAAPKGEWACEDRTR